ncbi:unnamed protein product, partial [Rotaria sordida]
MTYNRNGIQETRQYIIRKYKQTKCISNLFGSGGKRKTTAATDRFIVRKIKINRRKSADMVKDEIEFELEISLHANTIQNRLHEAGLFGRIARKKPLVNKKCLYDTLRAQGVNGEPFVPLIGQLPQFRRYRNTDMIMKFQEDLVKKHGDLFVFGFGPIIRLVINEPDLLADVLSRTNAQNYIK